MNSVRTAEPPIQSRLRQFPPLRASGFEFYILVFLLFLLYSRVFDFFPVPMVAMLTFIVSIAATVFSGRVLWLVQPRISKLWIMLTGWLVVSAALSIWRIGSMLTLQSWLKTLSVYFVTIGLITTLDQSYRAIRTVAWSIGILAGLSFVYGDSTGGRLFMEAGKFQGPNELAQVLLFGLPLLWLVFSRSPRISVQRLLLLSLMLILVNVLLRTASRGAMITAVVMAVAALAGRPSKGKVIAVLGGGLVIVIGGLALSESARSRYLTFFDASIEQGDSKQTVAMEEIATASADQRWGLLLESLKMTLEHPLAGVGPGMFAEERERRARTERTHIPYLVTHNTYTEFSTEGGIPAALLFIAILVGCYRTASRLERLAAKQPTKRLRDVAAMASALKFSILSFGVSAIFISVAYQSFMETLAGLVVALEYTFMKELASQAPVRTPPPAARNSFGQRLPMTPSVTVSKLGLNR